MAPVEIVHWNPPPGKLGRLLALLGSPKRVDNFGDLLGPLIVKALVESAVPSSEQQARLLTVGSILHFARPGDVIWGSGRNGKISPEAHTFERLDVRAVRGPLTREFLESHGAEAPEIYGDPGLLFPLLYPKMVRADATPRGVLLVPNMNDAWEHDTRARALNPRFPLRDCLQAIASSELVIASSLHALVIAESLGIPAVPVRSLHEPEFKYLDYYFGTGRADIKFANDPRQALTFSPPSPPTFDAKKLLAAFPYDLWARTPR